MTPLAPSGQRGLRLRGVELFHVGAPRGLPHDARDMDNIVRNFQAFSTGDKPYLRVPMVRGHEEKDLDRSDLPAMGWGERVTHDGTTLYSDVGEVQPEFAVEIADKKYRTISPEIYPAVPDGIPWRRF